MIKTLKSLGVAALFATFAMSGAALGHDHEADAAAAAEVSSTRWCAADLAQDIDAKLALFTEDAVLVMPGREPLEGLEQIEAWQSQNYAMASLDCTDRVTIHEASVRGDLAIVRGRFEGTVVMKDGSASFDQAGHFLNLLQRGEDGRWQITRMAFVY